MHFVAGDIRSCGGVPCKVDGGSKCRGQGDVAVVIGDSVLCRMQGIGSPTEGEQPGP